MNLCGECTKWSYGFCSRQHPFIPTNALDLACDQFEAVGPIDTRNFEDPAPADEKIDVTSFDDVPTSTEGLTDAGGFRIDYDGSVYPLEEDDL